MSERRTATGTIFYRLLEPATGAKNVATVTLLHNFMSTGRMAWGPLLTDLTQHYRVLLPDLPGHGRSQGYPEQFCHLKMARQLAELMHAEGAAHGHLAGCSSGGMIAQWMVHYQLVRPATLALVSTTHSVNPQTTGEFTTLDPQNFRAGDNWLAATARLHDDHHYQGYFVDEVLAGFRKLAPRLAIDLPLSALEEWTLPVCLIHGAQDEIFPVSIARRMAATLPDAELHVISGQSHALLFRKANVVGKLLMDFLSRHPADGRQVA